MKHIMFCANCQRIVGMSAAAWELIKRHGINTLFLLDDHMNCCEKPDYHYVPEAQPIPIEVIRVWITKAMERSIADA